MTNSRVPFYLVAFLLSTFIASSSFAYSTKLIRGENHVADSGQDRSYEPESQIDGDTEDHGGYSTKTLRRKMGPNPTAGENKVTQLNSMGLVDDLASEFSRPMFTTETEADALERLMKPSKSRPGPRLVVSNDTGRASGEGTGTPVDIDDTNELLDFVEATQAPEPIADHSQDGLSLLDQLYADLEEGSGEDVLNEGEALFDDIRDSLAQQNPDEVPGEVDSQHTDGGVAADEDFAPSVEERSTLPTHLIKNLYLLSQLQLQWFAMSDLEKVNVVREQVTHLQKTATIVVGGLVLWKMLKPFVSNLPLIGVLVGTSGTVLAVETVSPACKSPNLFTNIQYLDAHSLQACIQSSSRLKQEYGAFVEAMNLVLRNPGY